MKCETLKGLFTCYTTFLLGGFAIKKFATSCPTTSTTRDEKVLKFPTAPPQGN